jgi:hypothetical protein
VKFVWGIFTCNELLCERFGMAETPNCACCGVVETPWHVVGECECGHAKAVEIRVDWTKRMWEGLYRQRPPDGRARWIWTWRMHCNECGRWRKEEPFERGNVERKTIYQVLTIWIVYTYKELLDGVAQAGSWALWMGVFIRGGGWISL